MKKLLSLILIVSLLSCEKKKEEVQEELVILAMTSGQWKVTNYTMGSMNHTSDFNPYLFQFKSNNTVDAINNGSVEKTGSWQGDPNARTIASQFTNANATLTLLNGTWNITRNSWTYVEAKQTINGAEHSLRLDKQ
jgi:lipopolysaccharide export LptBFGC system permease protein LptF